jgi:hypothetical protein
MLKLDYRLVGTGWAECTIDADGRRCDITASYLSDALGKLVLAAVAVLAGVQSISVRFDEEPGEYRWAIVMTGDDVVQVDILSFQTLWDNLPDAQGESLLRFSCAPIDFGKAVYVMADNVLERYGLTGYRQRWDLHDFPIAEFDLLRSYVLRRGS